MTHAVGSLVLMLSTLVAAVAGGLASAQAPAFYAELIRPGWAPPAWLFGPVWTLLYILMAIAAVLVWRRRDLPGSRPVLALYLVQLAANGLWSWLFFAWHLGAASVVDIIVLDTCLVVMIGLAWRRHRLAAVLWTPYLVWVVFATVLNLWLCDQNPALLG